MKKFLLVSLVFMFVGFLFYPSYGSDSPDPKYYKAFGYGKVIASNNGYPAFGSYDPSQFDYRDGVFYMSPTDTLDLRVLLPKGKKMSNYVKEGGFSYYKIWASTDYSGNSNITDSNPWPTKLSEEPNWSELFSQRYNVKSDFLTWNTSGVTWEEIKPDLSTWLKNAQPGDKLYVVFSTGGTVGGGAESKWNSTLQKFEMQETKGALEFKAPIAACEIEIK